MKEVLDFIVIGAQKAGTTSLFAYMRGHPNLHVPDAKEIPYFSHGEHALSWPEYLKTWFTGADPARRWGTVTPHYMVGGLYDADAERGDPRTVPARIRKQIPDVRLIAILRDPVERARSHYDWATQAGWETRPFEVAIHDLLRPEALDAARSRPDGNTGYITWGEYGRILSGYFDEFAREKILVVYTSDLKSAPDAVMRKVFGFLDVDVNYVPPNLGSVYRPTARVPRHFPGLRLEKLPAKFESHRRVMQLWHLLPESVRRQSDRLFGRLTYGVDTLNRRYPRSEFPHVERPPESRSDEPELEQTLRAYYQDDGRLLASILGAPPPWLRGHPDAASKVFTD